MTRTISLFYFHLSPMPTIRNKPVRKVLRKGKTAAKKNNAKQVARYKATMKKK